MNTKLFLASLAIIAGAVVLFGSRADSGLTDSATLSAFASFQRTFARKYHSPQEMEYRLGVFQSNLATIDAHNANPSATYTLEVNEFADLTYEEFAAKFLGAEGLTGSSKCEKSAGSVAALDDEQEVDWVKAGVVHPVKNQAACGSCWAFSAIGALEAAFAIYKGEKGLDLAEQELVDCSKKYGNHGCSGGLMNWAYDYILDYGINLTKDYPYTARDGACKAISGKGAHHLKGCRQVKRGVDNLVNDIRKNPIAVAFFVQDDFRFYKGGIYNPQGCRSNPNHGVTAVGFKLDNDVPYFYIKNSWGTGWGDKGFFKMAIGKNGGTCSIAAHDWNYYPTL